MNKLLFTKLRGKTAAILMEDSRIFQIELEPEAAAEETGAIYVGKVKTISKNINAAFVEYRPGVNGFYSLTENRSHLFADGLAHESLKAGDDLLVQVSRSAVKTKDAVLTSRLNLPGRYGVLTTETGKLGISEKIRDKRWREEFARLWDQEKERPYGLIVRTNAYEAGPEAVWAEVRELEEELSRILKAAPCRVCKSVLYRPESFAVRMVRDLPRTSPWEIVTDLREVYEELETVCKTASEDISLRFYEDSFPMTALYHLETALSQALSKVVWLKSGGNIVIEPTEAMTVIDVNTGKTVGKKAAAETFLKTNLEAASEIAAQLRLRNLSGIILVDFIDMKKKEDKDLLLKTFARYLSADRVKTVLVDMTALGLVEVTRKKIRRPLHEQVMQTGEKRKEDHGRDGNTGNEGR